jgi:hypothetical protein
MFPVVFVDVAVEHRGARDGREGGGTDLVVGGGMMVRQGADGWWVGQTGATGKKKVWTCEGRW